MCSWARKKVTSTKQRSAFDKRTSIKETHNKRVSSRMTYALPKTRTNYGIFNIRYQGAKIWNAINDTIGFYQ